jgi:hypothetical protein
VATPFCSTFLLFLIVFLILFAGMLVLMLIIERKGSKEHGIWSMEGAAF